MSALPEPFSRSVAESAYYGATIDAFLRADTAGIVGQLTINSDFAVEQAQRDAWLEEVSILQPSLLGFSGGVFFEYAVPRIGSRIDVVVIMGPAIVVLEFKAGESAFKRADENQVWDYALDLKNFHRGSHAAPIFPVLIATRAPAQVAALSAVHNDGVYSPMRSNPDGLHELLQIIAREMKGRALDANTWAASPYHPTPTIIQAAQALYANHSVHSITRSDAGAENLTRTSSCVEAVIERTRARHGRAIVFVTGVPGAGKTLVGLNLATKRRDTASETHAVYLSGNDPLVKVLREALTRDEVERLRRKGQRKTKAEVGQPIKCFIQNVHHFRDAGLRDLELPPSDHVVIFDEAQRAWSRDMTVDFMRRKKKRLDFDSSEPEFLISYLDRHPDWAVVVCLVGGGQEINRGEAGISAWLDAVRERFPHWELYLPEKLVAPEYSARESLEALKSRGSVSYAPELHLAVSMRSFRAERVSDFVHALLECEEMRAGELLSAIRQKYPIVLTRDLDHAKQWMRQQARANERVGLVASSAAHRLKPHAIDIRVPIDPVHWFLNDGHDPRSSMYLEDAATEFQVQGLELDWACVTWDADFRLSCGGWEYHSFVGSKWNRIQKTEKRQYLKNAYRVLLTRARQGMVIFVPLGAPEDATRVPEYYDGTFAYLRRLGIPTV